MRGKRIIYYLAGVVLVLVLLHLYIVTKSVALKYDIVHLKTNYREVKSKNRTLASALSAQESLGVIEQKAQKQLNMYYPDKVNYIIASKEAK